MPIAVSLLIASLPLVLAAQDREQKDDPSKLEIKLTGCARGSTFTETNLRLPDVSEEGPSRRWRLRGPKPLMKRIKEHEGREIEIAGTMKTAESSGAGGKRIGKTNIYIGGDPNRTTNRDPLPELPTIDIVSFEPTGEACK